MPATADFVSEGLRFLAGVVATLTTVWVARIVRGGTLAESLRQEQADIRVYLKEELGKVRAEHSKCEAMLNRMESTMDAVRGLLRLAVDRRAGGMAFDIEMAAALAKLEETNVPE